MLHICGGGEETNDKVEREEAGTKAGKDDKAGEK